MATRDEPDALDPASLRETEAFKQWVNYDYASHTAALACFKAGGLDEAVLTPAYTPAELRMDLQGKLNSIDPRIRVIDITSKVPTTPSGSIEPWLKTIFRARETARTNPNALVYMQRTAANTPAFVHSFAFGPHAKRDISRFTNGTGEAIDAPAPDASYAGLVIFRNNEITVPARLCVSSAEVVSDMIATMLDVGHHGFKCGICNVGFSRWTRYNEQNVRGIDDLLATDCDHLFHPDCVVRRFRQGLPDADKCPICGLQLPVSAVAEGEAPPVNGLPLGCIALSPAERAVREQSPQGRWRSDIRSRYNADALSRSDGCKVTRHPARGVASG